MYEILNIGSGEPGKYHHFLDTKNTVHADFNRNAFHVTVVCDAHNLPFRDNTFKVAVASHIIEHLTNPHKATMELQRTAETVIVKVPNAGFYKWKNLSHEHLYGWDQYTLENFLKSIFQEVNIQETRRQIPRNPATKLLLTLLSCLLGKEELTAVCKNAKF